MAECSRIESGSGCSTYYSAEGYDIWNHVPGICLRLILAGIIHGANGYLRSQHQGWRCDSAMTLETFQRVISYGWTTSGSWATKSSPQSPGNFHYLLALARTVYAQVSVDVPVVYK